MGKNIVLLAMSTFASKVNEEGVLELHEHCYQGENEKEVILGYSQLEPITKWLSSKYEIAKIIILCTPEVSDITKAKKIKLISRDGEKEEIKEIEPCSPYDFWKKRIEKARIRKKEISQDEFYKKIKYQPNDYKERICEVVNEIRKCNSEDNMKLWIDTQGGFRDIQLVMNAIISLLRIENIYPEGIYSIAFNKENSKEKPSLIVSQKEKYDIFKFVSGMQEFIYYGKTNDLQQYYEQYLEDYNDSITDKNKRRISELLEIISKISESIQSCNPDNFIESIKSVKEYLSKHSEKQEEFIDIFNEYMKNDYGELLNNPDDSINPKASINIIKWCLRKDLLQQALTFIEDKLPSWYVDNKVIYYEDQKALEGYRENEQERKYDKTYHDLKSYFFYTYCTELLIKRGNKKNSIPKFSVKGDGEIFKDIQNIARKIRRIRKKEKKSTWHYRINIINEKVAAPYVQVKSDYVKTDAQKENLRNILSVHQELKNQRNNFNHANGNSLRMETGELKKTIESYIEALEKTIKEH